LKIENSEYIACHNITSFHAEQTSRLVIEMSSGDVIELRFKNKEALRAFAEVLWDMVGVGGVIEVIDEGGYHRLGKRNVSG